MQVEEWTGSQLLRGLQCELFYTETQLVSLLKSHKACNVNYDYWSRQLPTIHPLLAAYGAIE